MKDDLFLDDDDELTAGEQQRIDDRLQDDEGDFITLHELMTLLEGRQQ